MTLEKNLRESLTSVRDGQSRTIFMKFQPLGWARFIIDDTIGSLTIDSDWGAWSHVWGGGPSNWGFPTFTEFLTTRADYHYLVDKLHYGGRTRDVIDGVETRKAMINKIARARLGNLHATHYSNQNPRCRVRYSQITKERAKELVEGVDQFVYNIEDKAPGDHIWHHLRAIKEECYCDGFGEFFDDVHDLIVHMPHPRLVFLRDQLLPLLVAYLRGEISVPGSSPPEPQPVDAGQARVAKRVPRRRKKADQTVARRRRR